MSKQIVFLMIIVASSISSAKLTDGTEERRVKKVRTHSVLFNTQDEPICALGYNDTDISSLGLPLCNENQAVLLDSVKPDGVDVAFLSHIGAAVVGCAVGVATDFIFPNDRNQSIAITFTEGALTGLVSAKTGAFLASSDPTGHGIAAFGGAMVCNTASTVMRTFFVFRAM